jgi:hypothetical protein
MRRAENIGKMDAADPTPRPARADIEIKNKHRFFGCDPVTINRTIRKSAV